MGPIQSRTGSAHAIIWGTSAQSDPMISNTDSGWNIGLTEGEWCRTSTVQRNGPRSKRLGGENDWISTEINTLIHSDNKHGVASCVRALVGQCGVLFNLLTSSQAWMWLRLPKVSGVFLNDTVIFTEAKTVKNHSSRLHTLYDLKHGLYLKNRYTTCVSGGKNKQMMRHR